jgi:hypothetical protein
MGLQWSSLPRSMHLLIKAELQEENEIIRMRFQE